MTAVVLLALGFGVGLVGIVAGIRGRRTSLQAVLAGVSSDSVRTGKEGSRLRGDTWRMDHRLAGAVAKHVQAKGYLERALGTRLALANTTLEELLSRCIVCCTTGLLLPALAWMVLIAGGVRPPLIIPIGVGILLGIGGLLVPISALNADAKRGLRHARRVICSFLDLVVLGLAGGMGIESALLAAAQLGENGVSRRLWAALSLCRDTGEPPWAALSRAATHLASMSCVNWPPPLVWQEWKAPRSEPRLSPELPQFDVTNSQMQRPRRMH